MLNRGYELVTSAEKLGDIANAIDRVPRVAIDLETTPKKGYEHVEKAALNPHTSRIRLLQVYDGEKIWIIDTWATGKPEPVIRALGNAKIRKLIQNAKYEQKMCLNEWGLEVDPVYDTMIGSGLIAGGVPGTKHTLDAVGATFLGYHGLVDKEEQKSDWSGELRKDQLDYAADDVFVLPRIREKQIEKLTRMSLINIANIEFDAVLPVAAMELRGLCFDRERWEKLVAERIVSRREALKFIKHELNPYMSGVQEMLPFAGFEDEGGINIDSHQQLLRALKKMGVAKGVLQLQWLNATNKDALKNIEDCHEIIKYLLEYSSAEKAISTYGDAFTGWVCKECGRIHTSFWPLTGAGRYSSKDPNMQNIPRDSRYRACFIPAAGWVMVAADWSQIELRIVGEMSEDRTMIQIYGDGGDIHKTTAAATSGKSVDKLGKDDRQRAKAVNFGLCIAEGQLVLTDSGEVPIEQVKNTHLVWDGVEWVQHEGVIFMGERDVMEYDGLIATPDHEVFTDEGYKVSLQRVASSIHFGRLAVGAVDCVPVRYFEFDRKNSNTRKEQTLRRSVMSCVQETEMDVGGQRESKKDNELSLSTKVRWRPTSEDVRRTLRCYGTALLSRYACFIASVQRAWDKSSIRFTRRLCFLGDSDVPENRFSRFGFRSNRQRRSVLERKSSIGNTISESKKSVAKVYDLVNAGPRHRFTVSGKVVSNCYGMGGDKLRQYAKSSYGVDMTDAQAERAVEKYFKTYPDIKSWQKETIERGRKLNRVRTMSGRIRFLNDDQYSEYVNSPVQGTGADMLKVALRLVYDGLKRLNLRARLVHMIHDELIVESHPDDAEAAKVLLEKSMKEAGEVFLKKIPIVVEGKIGANWATVK